MDRRSFGRGTVMVLFLASAAGLTAPTGWAGDPPPGGQGPGRQGRGRGGPENKEMREAIEQVMLVRLKEALAMTPEQEQKVVPRVTRLQEMRRDFHAQRHAAVAHLRALLADATARPDDLEKALRDLRALESSFRQREESIRTEIEQDLDARQQVRLYFFEDKFRRQMQRRLHDALHGGPGGEPGKPPRGTTSKGPPSEDGEEELP